MSYERKELTRETFNMLVSIAQDGSQDDAQDVVPLSVVLQSFDATAHPTVVTGQLSATDAVQLLLVSCLCVPYGYQPRTRDARGVSWQRFLDYYKGVSAGVPVDADFALLLRNVWHVAVSSPTRRGGSSTSNLMGSTTMAQPLSVPRFTNTSNPYRPKNCPATVPKNAPSFGPLTASPKTLPACYRVIVTHSDGSEEVVELLEQPWGAAGFTRTAAGRIDRQSIMQLLNAQGVYDIADLRM